MDKENAAGGPRGRIDFSVESASGSTLSCVLTEAPQRPQNESSPVKGTEVDPGILVLVHASPLGHRGCPPLPQLSTFITAPTVRFDLTGCGNSSGEPQPMSLTRDVKDIRAVVMHLQQEMGRKVLGLVGFALGGTAVLLYASQHRDIKFAVTIAASVTLTNAFSSLLTWSQLQELRRQGELQLPHRDAFGRDTQLRLTAADLDARPDLSGLAQCTTTEFLALYSSQDTTVPPSDVQARRGHMLCGEPQLQPLHPLHAIQT